jgi:hypothetical protein
MLHFVAADHRNLLPEMLGMVSIGCFGMESF